MGKTVDRTRHRRVHGGIIRPLDDGRVMAEFSRGGERKRRLCDNETSATNWLFDRWTAFQNNVVPLSPGANSIARQASDLLPKGITLLDAARFWVQHHRRSELSENPISDLFVRFMSEKSASGLRPRSISQLRSHIRQLVDSCPDKPISEITAQQLIDWLAKHTSHPLTRDGFRRSWRNFFGFCKRLGAILENPADAISAVKFDTPAPEIYTPEQVFAFLSATSLVRPRLLPLFVLGFFTGLRTAELHRITWADIGQEYIRVTAAASKRRSSRLIPAQPAIRAWLPKTPTTGRIYSGGTRTLADDRSAILKAAGIAEWPKNVMRHSYISYRLAQTKSLEQVRMEAGNSTDIILEHYRELVTSASAAAYFALSPRTKKRQIGLSDTLFNTSTHYRHAEEKHQSEPEKTALQR